MTEPGHRIFADELARFAARHADPRVTAVARRAAAPLRVAVRGRRGVGCRTVTRALDRAGNASDIDVVVDADAADADVVVYVTTEVLKPEDADAINGIVAAGRPVLAVLNKADVVMLNKADPRARCADFAALTGAPMAPMSGLLAVAALDDLDPELWAALRALAADPGGAGCLDGSFAGFLAARVPVPADVRRRLLDALDALGTAVGIAALRRGGTRAQVRALLRRMSGVDAVLKGIAVVGAEVRYRRVLGAVAELEALAVGHDAIAGAIGEFLACDDTVVARMAAAVDLAESAGLDRVDCDRDDPGAHLPRAVRWQRYSRAAGGDLQRACGADIARGSLRLWSQACASAPGGSR